MKGDDCDPPVRLEAIRQAAQTFLERAKLIVHFHPQRLKNLRRGMTSSVAADHFLNRVRELKRFTKRRFLAQLDEPARDPARGRFFAEFAEQASEILFAV